MLFYLLKPWWNDSITELLRIREWTATFNEPYRCPSVRLCPYWTCRCYRLCMLNSLLRILRVEDILIGFLLILMVWEYKCWWSTLPFPRRALLSQTVCIVNFLPLPEATWDNGEMPSLLVLFASLFHKPNFLRSKQAIWQFLGLLTGFKIMLITDRFARDPRGFLAQDWHGETCTSLTAWLLLSSLTVWPYIQT